MAKNKFQLKIDLRTKIIYRFTTDLKRFINHSKNFPIYLTFRKFPFAKQIHMSYFSISVSLFCPLQSEKPPHIKRNLRQNLVF